MIESATNQDPPRRRPGRPKGSKTKKPKRKYVRRAPPTVSEADLDEAARFVADGGTIVDTETAAAPGADELSAVAADAAGKAETPPDPPPPGAPPSESEAVRPDGYAAPPPPAEAEIDLSELMGDDMADLFVIGQGAGQAALVRGLAWVALEFKRVRASKIAPMLRKLQGNTPWTIADGVPRKICLSGWKVQLKLWAAGGTPITPGTAIVLGGLLGAVGQVAAAVGGPDVAEASNTNADLAAAA